MPVRSQRSPRPRAIALGALAAIALAAPAGAESAPSSAVRPPLMLPGDAAAASIRADQATWLIGARPGAKAAARIARRHGARPLGTAAPGGYVVARDRARGLASALRARHLLVSAEPNGLARSKQAIPPDPLSPRAAWRDHIVDPGLPAPTVTPQSPLIALVDSSADFSHGEWAGGNGSSAGALPVTDPHGTATAAVAAAPKNDIGILGVWPGARARNYPLPGEIRCSDVVAQIGRAVQEGAVVINMSFGSTSLCFQQYAALQFATARGVVLVAAAGNEFAEGNPLEYPASLPHVLTITALTPQRTAAYFSNVSAAMDLGAPGVGIVTAVPPLFDTDGVADGYQALDGTSFAAPMVSAAVAWVRAARPDLSADQVAQVVRLSATDLDKPGWDPVTGFGQLSVSGALARQPPPRDPTEPNDDIVWIDGTAFEKPDAPIWQGRGRRTFTALLDRYEDPADVYRIVLRRRGRARITVKPRFGNPDLVVLSRKADSISERRSRVARSRHTGQRVDRVTIRNGSRRARSFFIAVPIDRRGTSLDAAYDLSVRR